MSLDSYDYVDSDPVVPIRIRSSHSAVMSDDPEILIGTEILDKYIVCFDGIRKRVNVKK